ncbi:hypothetical protein, partial [Thioclava electrotropha]|uniref:hypothetical protein n=1 Tax=Thioclava electrotropha TaxID=1549850 RepID=UPI0023A7C428
MDVFFHPDNRAWGMGYSCEGKGTTGYYSKAVSRYLLNPDSVAVLLDVLRDSEEHAHVQLTTETRQLAICAMKLRALSDEITSKAEAAHGRAAEADVKVVDARPKSAHAQLGAAAALAAAAAAVAAGEALDPEAGHALEPHLADGLGLERGDLGQEQALERVAVRVRDELGLRPLELAHRVVEA